MKKRIAVISVAVALVATCFGANDYVNMAGRIEGTNSFSAAAYSGLNSVGNFTTAVGNNSFRESQQNDGVAIGSMALSNAKGGDLNVMVGVYAGFGSTNLHGCVGIGAGTFMGANAQTNATSINGHFVAQGDTRRFWITPDKMHNANWDGCPPIYYDNGTLYLNARAIVKREGVVEKTAPLHAANWTGAMDDAIFVATYGDDEYDGSSTYYPKRTLQGALTALTNDTTTIYLDGGVYESPEYLNRIITTLEHRVTIVGVGKPEDTIIDCGGVRKLNGGASGFFARFSNVTLKDVCVPNAGSSTENRGAIQLAVLNNCRVVGTMTVANSYWPFFGVVFEDSEIDITLNTSGTPGATPGHVDNGYEVIFHNCFLYDTVANIKKGVYGLNYPNFGYRIRAENCHFDIGGEVYYSYLTWGNPLNMGERGAMLDCTLAISNVVGLAYSTGTANNADYTNLVFAVGSTTPVNSKASFCTSYDDLKARLSPDTLRPYLNDFDLLPFGYGSAYDRSVRDGAMISVMNILEVSGSLSAAQSAALAAAKPSILRRNSVKVKSERASRMSRFDQQVTLTVDFDE